MTEASEHSQAGHEAAAGAGAAAPASLPPAVADIIQRLGMLPHPEGGFYKETFRDTAEVNGRAVSTAILYLLPAGAKSKLHRLDASECWHAYLGRRAAAAALAVVMLESCYAKHATCRAVDNKLVLCFPFAEAASEVHAVL